MLPYGATMFLSAFLLFLVQPLLGKYILPWFGGAPAVWTTCMLFFQILLLAGYSYADLLASRLPLRRQVLLHLTLVIATLFSLPIVPSPTWKPVDGGSPILRILGLLAVSVGAPYLLLSTTAPLLQSWFSRTRPAASPYRLYALSNLGSLMAILCYPFLLEPSLSLGRQASIWSWSYGLFVLMCALLSLRVYTTPLPPGTGQAGIAAPPAKEDARPGPGRRLLWLALPACSSAMLLATTNQMCQDVAVVPLLWILPLALYLLSFIICFQYERFYWRPLFVGGLAAAIAWTCVILFGSVFVNLRLQLLSYALTLFTSCMVCHGELVRLKPGSQHITSFYLMVAGGGTLGGILITLVAPQLFRDFWEYHLSLLATAALTMICLFRDPNAGLHHGRPLPVWSALYFSFLALAVALGTHIRQSVQNSMETARSFFGVLHVLELNQEDPLEHRLTLMHGRIEHGFQFVDPEKRHWPTSYFGPDSGAGLAICYHPARREFDIGKRNLRIGVVGLGTGTLAAYGMKGDYIRFYEINPQVIQLADKYFTYRKDSAARVDVVQGDARISLERERQNNDSQEFDILAVDAFSSDAIPVHLLTRECFRSYLYHLKPDGILAIHISNRYFDLSPVVRNMASLSPDPGTQAILIACQGVESLGTDSTDWILVTSNREFLADPHIQNSATPWTEAAPARAIWTDDSSDLFSLLRK